MNLPDDLKRLLREVPALSRAYLVGGCVRDSLLGIAHKDFDLEVYGLDYETLARQLSAHGRVDLVGKSFGVIKFTGPSGGQWDFSLPRRDSKMSAGHKGFQIEVDSDIDPKVAASRRDFTINALAFDPRTGDYLDFFGGREDLAKRVLRHTSAAFVEDPLRVLRGMQFAARFDLTPAPETVALCRSIVGTFSELAVERVGMEWFKWAMLSQRPSAGLRFLKDTGWLRHFPEIAALDGTPQDPEWHPEGDVFAHTCHCCDALPPGLGLTLLRINDCIERVLPSACCNPGVTAREVCLRNVEVQHWLPERLILGEDDLCRLVLGLCAKARPLAGGGINTVKDTSPNISTY